MFLFVPLLLCAFVPHYSNKKRQTRIILKKYKTVSLLVSLLLCVLLLKLLYPSFGVNQFLLAGIERMTARTDINVYGRLCGSCSKRRPACAHSLCLFSFGMNFLFHHLPLCPTLTYN